MIDRSRRRFIKSMTLGAGALFLKPWLRMNQPRVDWPDADRLGRNCVQGKVEIRKKPDAESASVGNIYEDAVVVWLREVIGVAPAGRISRRWVETPEGYIYAASLQPVRNLPNKPINNLPNSGEGKGMWAEVTIPFINFTLVNPKPASPWLKAGLNPRLYYSQVMWIDDVKTNSGGQVMYRVSEKYGSYGDLFWANAEAFRPITAEGIAPIAPYVTEKKIVVDLARQSLACLEGKQEVYYCRISSGARYDAQGNPVEKWSTPPGPHPIWRKMISTHMSGGTTGAGWDTPGIGWTSLFSGDGPAIHSTFWHNDFGVARSHGCVNATPEDAKWIFRWTNPIIIIDPGELTVQMPGGTIVEVIES